MNEITKMLSEKFNLSPEMSQQIVAFILEQVKGKLPEGLGQQLEGIVAQGGLNSSGGGEGLLDSVKNMASNLMGKA